MEIMLPVYMSLLLGPSKYKLELGVGVSARISFGATKSFNGIIPYLGHKIGFRNQKPEGGYFFAVSYYGLIDPSRQDIRFMGVNLGKFAANVGVSFGYTLKNKK